MRGNPATNPPGIPLTPFSPFPSQFRHSCAPTRRSCAGRACPAKAGEPRRLPFNSAAVPAPLLVVPAQAGTQRGGRVVAMYTTNTSHFPSQVRLHPGGSRDPGARQPHNQPPGHPPHPLLAIPAPISSSRPCPFPSFLPPLLVIPAQAGIQRSGSAGQSNQGPHRGTNKRRNIPAPHPSFLRRHILPLPLPSFLRRQEPRRFPSTSAAPPQTLTRPHCPIDAVSATVYPWKSQTLPATGPSATSSLTGRQSSPCRPRPCQTSDTRRGCQPGKCRKFSF